MSVEFLAGCSKVGIAHELQAARGNQWIAVTKHHIERVRQPQTNGDGSPSKHPRSISPRRGNAAQRFRKGVTIGARLTLEEERHNSP